MTRADSTVRGIFARRLLIPAIVITIPLLGFGTSILAHEHTYTHHNLTRAAFRLLNSPFFKTEEGSTRFGGLSEQDIEDELAHGVIDEAACKIVRVTSTDSSASSRDWKIVDDLVVRLRAEAPAGAKHRRYDVHVECSDAAGSTSAGVVSVRTGERTPEEKQ
jgi:hypothetical protein